MCSPSKGTRQTRRERRAKGRAAGNKGASRRAGAGGGQGSSSWRARPRQPLLSSQARQIIKASLCRVSERVMSPEGGCLKNNFCHPASRVPGPPAPRPAADWELNYADCAHVRVPSTGRLLIAPASLQGAALSSGCWGDPRPCSPWGGGEASGAAGGPGSLGYSAPEAAPRPRGPRSRPFSEVTGRPPLTP